MLERQWKLPLRIICIVLSDFSRTMEAERKYPHTSVKGAESGLETRRWVSKSKLEDSVAGAREMVQLVQCLVCKDARLHSEHQHPCKAMGKRMGLRQLWCWWGRGRRIHESHLPGSLPQPGLSRSSGRPHVKEQTKE